MNTWPTLQQPQLPPALQNQSAAMMVAIITFAKIVHVHHPHQSIPQHCHIAGHMDQIDHMIAKVAGSPTQIMTQQPHLLIRRVVEEIYGEQAKQWDHEGMAERNKLLQLIIVFMQIIIIVIM